MIHRVWTGHSRDCTVYLPPQLFHISDDWVLATVTAGAGKYIPNDKAQRGHRVQPLRIITRIRSYEFARHWCFSCIDYALPAQLLHTESQMLLDVFAGFPVTSHIHKFLKQTTLHPPILKLTYQFQYSTLSHIPNQWFSMQLWYLARVTKGTVHLKVVWPCVFLMK